MRFNPATNWMPGSLGLMHHLITEFEPGHEYGGFVPTAEEYDRLIDRFDIGAWIKAIRRMKPDFVVLALSQNSGLFCSPNRTLEAMAGYSPGRGTSRRDLPTEMASALRPMGIRLILYLPSHPGCNDPHLCEAMGWIHSGRNRNPRPGPDQYGHPARWYSVIREWSERYGDDLAGWVFDGVYFPEFHYYAAFADAAKAGGSDRVISFNGGMVAPITCLSEHQDFTFGELNAEIDFETFYGVPTSRWTSDVQWYAHLPLGIYRPFQGWRSKGTQFPTEKLVRYIPACLAGGGCFALDLWCDWTGELDPEQVAQFEAVRAAWRHP